MKRFSKLTSFACLTAVLFSACSLDEDNKSSIDSGSYFREVTQYEQLVAEGYLLMRPLLRSMFVPMWYGTDMYEVQGDVEQISTRTPTNDYTIMGGDEYLDFWNKNYALISKVNTAIDRGAGIASVSDGLRAQREAEMKALRAYAYFNLVENFGRVPLILNEPKAPIYTFVQESEENLYKQIVQDLNEALAALPSTASGESFGRVSKGFVYHLLAKVYLTRSGKTFGSESSDLAAAIENADNALALYPLLTGTDAWNILFQSDGSSFNQRTSEIIFSVRYSTNQTYNGSLGTEEATWGNDLYQFFKPELEKLVGGSVTYGPYWRCDYRVQPTTFYIMLFDENDKRGSEAFLQRHVIAAEDDPDVAEVKRGTELIYFPRQAMTDAEITAYKAANPSVQWVVNPDEYNTYLSGTNYNAFPPVWKFFDTNVNVYTNADRNPKGTLDTYVFRSAETLLLKAEALVRQGNGASATTLINQLRTRAGADLLTGTATLDDVLDESARELFGETNRWMDLKRTGKLFERAWKYNVWVKKQHASASAISSDYLLRPIPITEIANSQKTLEQNPGFPE